MTISIKALTFETIIGILDFERTRKQRVIIDIMIEYEYSKTFINYADIIEHIKAVMKKEKFTLIEEALLALKSSLKSNFPLINKLNLQISKPDILPDCEVCVSESYEF